MSNSEYLIRYLSLGKFVDLLTNKDLFLSRIDKFEDKTEGEWFAHLAKAANKSINEWQLRCNQSLKKLNQAIARLNSPKFDDIVNTIKTTLTQEEIHELDISDDMSQVMDAEFFESVEERIDFLIEVEQSYLIDTITPNEEVEYNNKRIKEIDALKKRAFVSSWFSSDSHSIAMWKLYGITEEGIAIRVRKDRLKSIEEINEGFLKFHDAQILFNDVIYVSSKDTEMGSLIDRSLSHDEWMNFRDLLLKNTAYKYEEEYRITLILNEESEEFKYGIKLNIGDLNDFIESVYLNPIISESHWYRNVVLEVMKRFDINVNKLKSGEIRTDFTK